jgi:hypothetical protein
LTRAVALASAAATIGFGVAVAIGCGAALAGLGVSSLWQDELYTGWIVDPAIGLPGTIVRALHDIGPPLYYLLQWPVSRLLGDGEIGLRLLSALSAIAAVLLFIAGGARFFSLQARLFGAALATGSAYWAAQAQNARGYALGLLISTGMLLLALAALKDRGRRTVLVGLIALMLAGTFTHFYLLFEALAVLAVLFLYRPRDRVLLAGAGALLLAVAVLYVELVIRPSSYAALDQNWIPGDADWYVLQLQSSVSALLPRTALLALGLCGALALVGVARRQPPVSASAPWVLCLAVPALVALEAVAASLLTTPNFHHRYLLIGSPFLWAAAALLYERGVGAAAPPLRALAGLVLAALTLWMAVTMAAARQRPSGEPFRSSAQAIAALPACKGAAIPAVVSERRRWFRSADGIEPIRAAYAKYLAGFAQPQPIFLEDVLAQRLGSLTGLLQQRIDEGGCPVLAWVVHGIEREAAQELGASILSATGRDSAAARLEVITFPEGPGGYLVTIRR